MLFYAWVSSNLFVLQRNPADHGLYYPLCIILKPVGSFNDTKLFNEFGDELIISANNVDDSSYKKNL